ncbi:hypothetical protein [Desulfobotulus mexicanus]|uniref:Uncharacterized protein n=1 Tax=Desulfobotulus mexicanus TaxID=2586642 RepID=A0A5Q4VB46_9BACT|nr:hypothetical protein [Desulfobotulus mexicanus]TYT74974.1 hypothetical protein FIM25_07580 [Desulfobotulus mexicanus]
MASEKTVSLNKPAPWAAWEKKSSQHTSKPTGTGSSDSSGLIPERGFYKAKPLSPAYMMIKPGRHNFKNAGLPFSSVKIKNFCFANQRHSIRQAYHAKVQKPSFGIVMDSGTG